VVDTARAILDGHIVLSRALAEQGHYPAIDIGASVSRCMSQIGGRGHLDAARTLKALWGRYQEIRGLIPLGGYVPGADAQADRAVRLMPQIEQLLCQRADDAVTLPQVIAQLEALLA
jgi:flagellum-specific ATP synthase